MEVREKKPIYSLFCEYPEVVVVGSANLDFNVCVPRFPLEGETIKGSRFYVSFGGKGLNQATQAALLYPTKNCIRKKSVALVCKIGNDENGALIQKFLEKKNMRTSELLVEAGGVCTGVASILNTESKENIIIVVPGANEKLLPNDVKQPKIKQLIQNAKIVLAQNEIPLETTLEVFRIAKEKRENNSNTYKTNDFKYPFTVYTPSPVNLNAPKQIYELTDFLCMNAVEASQIFDSNVNVDFLKTLSSSDLNDEHIKQIKKWVADLATQHPKTCGSKNKYEIKNNEQTKDSSAFNLASLASPMFSHFLCNLSYIITLDKHGCCVMDRNRVLNATVEPNTLNSLEDKIYYIPAKSWVPKKNVVCTVGAGDSFCGAFAFFIIKTLSVKEAATRANSVASLSVEKEGAANSYCEYDELPEALQTMAFE